MTVEHRESWSVGGIVEVTATGINIRNGENGLRGRDIEGVQAAEFYRELGEAMRSAGLLGTEVSVDGFFAAGSRNPRVRRYLDEIAAKLDKVWTDHDQANVHCQIAQRPRENDYDYGYRLRQVILGLRGLVHRLKE